MDDALAANKLGVNDLSFKKDVAESDYVLEKVRRTLQQPLWLQTYAYDLNNRIQQASALAEIADLSFREREINSRLSIPIPPVKTASTIPEDVKKQIPPELIPPLERLLSTCDRAAGLINQSMPRNKKAVLSSLFFDYLNPSKDKDGLGFIRQSGLQLDKLDTLLKKQKELGIRDDETIRDYFDASEGYDEASFREGAIMILADLDKIKQLLWNLPVDYQNDFHVSFQTPLGKVYLSGTGSETYTDDAFLIIDLGGDDIYLNNAGGANCLKGLPISVVLDRRGNDLYRSKLPGVQGAGIFGLGVLVDFEGNDTFECGSCGQGFGFFGLGILESCMGQKQSFKGKTLVQGAGLFGSGILRQVMEGNTRYEALSYSQGFAGVKGFGLLDDQHGNDEYIALGDNDVGWIPGHKFTMSQGFSIGMRPWFGGGIGILRDLFGNDTYKADVYGQGAGYWYSTGILFDSSGNDKYESKQYAQGAGIHLASGALIDTQGNDQYTCGSICQGGAHDYSAGILRDVRGDDLYKAVSTAQGAAINNSVAFLIDLKGNDSYSGESFYDTQGSGQNGDRRQYGAIAGLFDFTGNDTYSQGWIDNMTWLKPFYGVGIDTQKPFDQYALMSRKSPRPPLSQIFTKKQKTYFTPYREIDFNHPTEIIFARANRSPSNEQEKAESNAAAKELKENPLKHLPYLISRMDSKNIIPRILVEQMVDQIKDEAIPALTTGLESENIDIVRTCLFYLARLNGQTAIPRIVKLAENPKLAGNCLYTLANLKAPAAYPFAMKYSHDPRENVRIRAAQALAYCPEMAATNRLVKMLNDPYFSVRYAAQESLIKKGPSILPTLLRGGFGASLNTRRHMKEIRIVLGEKDLIPETLELYPPDAKLQEAIGKKLLQSPQ
ncbi:MAG: HEAT repeat domain-containing protein [Verrucomicrobiota bacterium]|nr:HEAT repeat domain-containing protein [Verrucomicrobiota bacterium]